MKSKDPAARIKGYLLISDLYNLQSPDYFDHLT